MFDRQPLPQSQSQFLPSLTQVQRNVSNVVISDDTYCLSNTKRLKNENSSNINRSVGEKLQAKEEQNKFAMGYRGRIMLMNRSPEVYKLPPKALTLHPPNYYKNSRLNSKGAMHDFRKNRHSELEYEKREVVQASRNSRVLSELQSRNQQRDLHLRNFASNSALQPILEDEHAQVAHLREIQLPHYASGNKVESSRRSKMTELTADNGILFLDNKQRVRNPVNQPTPPPPFVGELIEEDFHDSSEPFYDHERAEEELARRKDKMRQLLENDKKIREAMKAGSQDFDPSKVKRKVVYVYENEVKRVEDDPYLVKLPAAGKKAIQEPGRANGASRTIIRMPEKASRSQAMNPRVRYSQQSTLSGEEPPRIKSSQKMKYISSDAIISKSRQGSLRSQIRTGAF